MPSELDKLVNPEEEQESTKDTYWSEFDKAVANEKLAQEKNNHELNVIDWAGTKQRELYSSPVYRNEWFDTQGTEPIASPGMGGAFMQGLTFNREDLFGQWGEGLPPTSMGESISSFTGSMVPLVASFLAMRYPLGYAIAAQEATGLLGRIGVEVGAGLVTDVGAELVNPSDTVEQSVGLIALGVAAGTFLPGNISNYDNLIKMVSKVNDRGVFIDIAKEGKNVVESTIAEQVAKQETFDLTPKILKPSQFKTDVGKNAVNDSPTQGTATIRAFNDLTESWVARSEQVSKELMDELDGFPVVLNKTDDALSIDPQTAAVGHGARIVDNTTKSFIDKTGGLTDFELPGVMQRIDEADIPFYDKEIIKEKIQVLNKEAWVEGTPDKYTTRVIDHMAEGVNTNDEYIYNSVDDLVSELRTTGDNLNNKLRPYTTPKQAEKYLAKLDEIESKLNDLPNSDKELIKLRGDLDTVIAHLKDPNIEFNVPPGFSKSGEIQRLFNNLTKASHIYKDRPDILEAQLDALASLAKTQDEALVAEFRQTMSELERYKAASEESSVDRVLNDIREGETPDIDTLNIYNKAKTKLKEQLKTEDPQYQSYDQLKFSPGSENAQVLAQLDQQLEQQANELLGGTWEQVKPFINDNRGNPNKIADNVVRARAASGDPQANDYILFENSQKNDVVFHSANPGIDAIAEPSAGGRSVKDVERITLEGVDLEGVTPDIAADRLELGDNFFARSLSDFKTRVDVYINKLRKIGDEAGASILRKVNQVANESVWDHRTFIGRVADLNDERNAMTSEWDKLGITEQMLEQIDSVSEQANTFIREAPEYNQGLDEALQYIDEWRAQQSDDVRKAYDKFRALEDKKFNEVSSFIDSMNKKYGLDIKKPRYRPGYIHFVYDGDWLFHIKNEHGDWKLPISTKTDLAKSLNELIERGENLEGVQFKIEPRWATDVEDFTIADSALKDGSAFGIDMSDLKDMYATHGKFKSDDVIDVVFGALRGRSLGLESRKKALRDSIAISDRLHTRYIHMLEPSIKLQQAVNTLDKAGFATLSKEMKLWANDMLGKSRNMEKAIDSHLTWVHKAIDSIPGARYTADSLGLRKGGRPLRTGIGLLATTGRMLSIGFNPMTALIQLTQGLTNVAPLAGSKNFFNGWRNLKLFVTEPRWKRLAQRANIQLKQVDGGLDTVRNEVTSSGWGSIGTRNISKPRLSQSRLERGVDLAEHYSMMPFNAVENRQRLASLYAFVKDGEDMAKRIKDGNIGKESKYTILQDIAEVNGKTVDDPEVLDQYALKMLDKLQFDFDTPGIAAIANNPLFKLPLQFKTYFMQEMEFLMGRKLPLTPAERFKSLAVFFGLGGMAGLPFVEDVDTIATKIFGKSPMLWMYANAPEVVVAGFPALANMNMAPLINAGGTRSMNIMPGFGGVLSSKLSRAKKEYETGSKDLLGAILGTNSMARNFVEAIQMYKYGAVYAPGGQTVLREGGTVAAVGEALGIQTYDNSALNALRLRKYKMQQDLNAKRRRDKETILNSDNEYQKGRELGYTRDEVKEWIKDRKKGVSTGNVSKEVDALVADTENKIMGRF